MAAPSRSAVQKLSQSKSKQEFFERLGWDENNDGYKRLYQMMMEEAAAGRARTVQDRDNLTPQSRNDPRVGDGPYSSAMITETARYREIQSIYQSASQETRAWYDLGITSEGGWDNWIIRWCLWHVFRYRDDRNRNRRSPNRNTTPPEWQSQAQSPTYAQSHVQSAWAQQYSTQQATSMSLLPGSSPCGTSSEPLLTPNPATAVRTRYDPVYDRTSYEPVSRS